MSARRGSNGSQLGAGGSSSKELAWVKSPTLTPALGCTDLSGSEQRANLLPAPPLRRFALHIPKSLPLAATAPLLCAGITTYSPLRYYGLVSGCGSAAVGAVGHCCC